ncbi:L-methionine (R)-S-oxide reductase [Malassezia pachydermatis]
MVHADAAGVPMSVDSKAAFYEHVSLQVQGILDGQQNWVTNLANVSAILYNAMNHFDAWKEKRVNWAGFYLLAPLFPGTLTPAEKPMLQLGPFCGMPACQAIPSVPGAGVCADGSAVLPPAPLCVPRTDDYPNHIACDSLSQSEIVVPLVVPRSALSEAHQAAMQGHGPDELVRAWSGRGDGDRVIIGVLDIDCEATEGFTAQDSEALTALMNIVVEACDWNV